VYGLRVKATLAALLLSGPASAGDVTVEKAWFRAMPARLPAAGYFTIHNVGKSAMTLTGASSTACGMLMLHKSSTGTGMASMSDLDRVAVPAGGTLAFAPNGFHLMCMDPTPVLKHGTTVPVTLQFANGKTLTAGFTVKNARGR
jgi:copper(I)-binding protein